MQDLPLDTMSAKELRELRDLVDQAIATVTLREKAALMERMAALAAQHGLSLSDIADAPAPAMAAATAGSTTARPRRAKRAGPAET